MKFFWGCFFSADDLQLKFVEVGGLSLLKSFLFASQEDVRVLSVNLILNLSAFHGEEGESFSLFLSFC